MTDIVVLLRASDPEEIWTGRNGLFDRAADEIVRLRNEVASLRDVVKHARQLVAEGHYCTVAQAGSGAGPGNRLRDALDTLDAAEDGR